MPVVGLEPTTLAGRDFESRAYANSATPASYYIKLFKYSLPFPLFKYFSLFRASV